MKSPFTHERQQEIKAIAPETVEAFLARGGKVITKVFKKKTKVDVQALLDASIGTEYEQEVIRFLTTQGIEVQ